MAHKDAETRVPEAKREEREALESGPEPGKKRILVLGAEVDPDLVNSVAANASTHKDVVITYNSKNLTGVDFNGDFDAHFFGIDQLDEILLIQGSGRIGRQGRPANYYFYVDEARMAADMEQLVAGKGEELLRIWGFGERRQLTRWEGQFTQGEITAEELETLKRKNIYTEGLDLLARYRRERAGGRAEARPLTLKERLHLLAKARSSQEVSESLLFKVDEAIRTREVHQPLRRLQMQFGSRRIEGTQETVAQRVDRLLTEAREALMQGDPHAEERLQTEVYRLGSAAVFYLLVTRTYEERVLVRERADADFTMNEIVSGRMRVRETVLGAISTAEAAAKDLETALAEVFAHDADLEGSEDASYLEAELGRMQHTQQLVRGKVRFGLKEFIDVIIRQ